VRAWWHGRFGRQLLLEAALLFSLLTLYRLGRYVARDQVEVAFQHARDVLRGEHHLGIATEGSFQDFLLDHLVLIRFLNRYYAMVHFPATVAFIVVTYAKAPEVYRRIRLVFISVTAVALGMQMAYPLAPPRMMAGFVDTIARYGPAIYSRPGVKSIANQYAAMPSLHIGWALIVAYGMLQLTRRPWRWVGVVHLVLTTLAVVGTANHYWADGLVALALVVVAVRVVDAYAARPVAAPAEALIPVPADVVTPAVVAAGRVATGTVATGSLAVGTSEVPASPSDPVPGLRAAP
jgi:hypothetical protein